MKPTEKPDEKATRKRAIGPRPPRLAWCVRTRRFVLVEDPFARTVNHLPR